MTADQVSMNQCDGCRSGWPVENGIHKAPSGRWHDNIGCTADRYRPVNLDAHRPHINEWQRCVDCGNRQVSTRLADVKREWWECTKCGQMSARTET